ncbi:purine-cytosine permease [Xylaria intraflava]|nr:purine-cytosine permease [Xylaria intraflava]
MASVGIKHNDEKVGTYDPAGMDIEAGQFSDFRAASGEDSDQDRSFLGKLNAFAGRYGMEQRGIERVPDEEKTDKSVTSVGTVWLSSNMVVSSFAIGALSVPVFGLGFVDSTLTIFFINILSIIPVCFFSTFGPRLGLRQMVLSRFFFGYYGVKLVAAFNVLACMGWAAVNVIVGAQLLHAVNNSVPGYAGVLIIAFSTLVIGTFGYKLVHTYERWSWIPCFIVFLIVLGVFAHSGHFNADLPLATGPAEAGAVLSFAASIFGFGTGWTSFSADYTVYQPSKTSRTSVFFWTFAGLIFPLVFTQLLGAAIATAMISNQAYSDAYSASGVGGLLAQVMVPPLGRFGQFCVVVLSLSIVANNCPNIYSAALTLQVLTSYAERVPRFLLTVLSTGIYIAIAIPGYTHFESALENLLLLIGYWLSIYEGISFTEHFVFRRGFKNYLPEDYASPKRLPPGYAAIVAFCIGIAGAVLGMAQPWFTGPIGKLCGAEFGGDVGFELAFCFSAVSFLGLRTLEYRHFGR